MKTTRLRGRPGGRKIQTWLAPLPNGPFSETRGGACARSDEPQPAARTTAAAAQALARHLQVFSRLRPISRR
jgi:hypothetical protein